MSRYQRIFQTRYLQLSIVHENKLERRRSLARLAATLVDGSDSQKQSGNSPIPNEMLFTYKQLAELSSAPELNIKAAA